MLLSEPKLPILKAVLLKLKRAVGNRLIQKGKVIEFDTLDKLFDPIPKIYVLLDDAKILNALFADIVSLFVVLLFIQIKFIL